MKGREGGKKSAFGCTDNATPDHPLTTHTQAHAHRQAHTYTGTETHTKVHTQARTPTHERRAGLACIPSTLFGVRVIGVKAIMIHSGSAPMKLKTR